MRILHVVPWYEPAWTSGGTAVAVSRLCRALAKNGVDVTVYTTNDAGAGVLLDVPLNQKIDVAGVKVWYFNCDFFLNKKAAFYSKKLSEKLANTVKDYDLVHISATRHWHGMAASKFCRRSGVPYIITPHASLMNWWVREIGNKYLKIPYLHLFERRVIKNASAIHYLCLAEYERSRRYNFGTESFIVPNGILVDDYRHNTQIRNKFRAKYKLKNNDTLLLHLGRIHPQKNIHLTIEAIGQLDIKKRDGLQFFIVGPISDKAYYNHLQDIIRRYQLSSTVKFFPPVQAEEAVKWYCMADLLALPSKVEGISMTSIEAMACSLPVLASNRVANFREIEQDQAGLIVEPNTSSIVSALNSILEERQLLNRLAENAVRSAINRYDIDQVASLMLTAYEDILAGNRSRLLI